MATRAASHRVALVRPIAIGPRGAGSNATIPVPGTGTLLIDADTLTVGAQTVLRPRDRIAGAADVELADVKTATPIGAHYGMVVLNHPNSAPLAVTGTFWQATQPVSGPLTDTQLRASAVPVSAGQLPAALGQTTMPNSLAVVIASNQSAVPVSGTFWQATQPVSLAAAVDVSDRAVRLVGVVYGSQGQQLKQTATNFNAQVEVAVGGTLVDPRAIRALTASDIVALGAGTAQIGLVKVSDGTNTAVVTAGGALNVAAPTLTKGTQAATGWSTQALKDSGRVNIMWTLEFSPAAIAEALMTMTESRDGAAVTTFTTKVVTSGKRLHITSWNMCVENTLGVNPKRAKLRMRFNTAGAVTTASPLQANLIASVATAVNTVGTTALDDFPDGIEYLGDGTKQIGFTLEFPDWVTAAQTGKVYVTIFGFEY